MDIIEDSDGSAKIVYNVVLENGGIIHFKNKADAQTYIDTLDSFVAAEEE